MYRKQFEDENVAEIFCTRLWNDIEKVWSSEVKPMVMTEDDKIDFDNATQCWICQRDYTGKDKKSSRSLSFYWERNHFLLQRMSVT